MLELNERDPLRRFACREGKAPRHDDAIVSTMTELAERTFISDPRFTQERKKHFASGNAALSALQNELVPQEASILNNETNAKGLREEVAAMAKVLTEIDEAIEAEEQNQGKKGKAKPAKGQSPADEPRTFSVGDREVLREESDEVSRLATWCEMAAVDQAGELKELTLAGGKKGYIEVANALHLETDFARPHFASEVFATLHELDAQMAGPPPPTQPALPYSWYSRHPAGKSVSDQAFRASWARGEAPPWEPGPLAAGSAARPSSSSSLSLGGSRPDPPQKSVSRIAPRIAPVPIPYEPADTIATSPAAAAPATAASLRPSSGYTSLRPASVPTGRSSPLRPVSSEATSLRAATSNPSCRAARPSSSASAARPSSTPVVALRPSASVPVLQRPGTAASTATSMGHSTRGSLGGTRARPATASVGVRLPPPAAAIAAHGAEKERARKLSTGRPEKRISSRDITTFLSGNAFDRDAFLSHLDPGGTSPIWHRRAPLAKGPSTPPRTWSQRMAPQDQFFKQILAPTDLPAAIYAAGERARPPPVSHKGGAPAHSGYLPISPIKAATVGPDAPGPDAPQSQSPSTLSSNMAKLRAAGLAIGVASGMSGLAEARGSGDDDYAPLGPVLYSAFGRKAALEMVAAAQLASQRARMREAVVKPTKPIWHNPNYLPAAVPPQRHDVRRKQLLAQAALNPPSAAELLEILQLTAHS
jgi:hypothetical protein